MKSSVTQRDRVSVGVALAWLVLLSVASPAPAAAPSGYYLAWSDEFNGTSLDNSKWDNWLLGTRRDAVNTGAAVSVGGGNLTLSTYTANGVNYTGMISTDGKFLPRYGYLEASIDYNDSPGMWSAFWMQSPWFGMFQGDTHNSGSEIDICEHRSTDGASDISGKVQCNIHWDFYGNGAPSTGSGNVGPGTLGSGFHIYGFQWDPTNYRLFIDGSQYYSTGSGSSQRTEFLILSSEVQNGSWAGSIPADGYGSQATTTTKMVVDYVRWYAPTSQVFWTGSGSALWTSTAPWIASTVRIPGAGDDVVFSTLTDANSTCTLGGNFSVRSLTFHDGPGFTINGGNTLTLGSGGIEASPAYNGATINCGVNVSVNQTWKVGPWRTVTIAGPISGAGAFTKTGFGTLRLSGTNAYANTLNVDSGSGSASDGAVCIANSASVANVASPILINNNNSGSSTLQLDGSGGSVSVNQDLQLSCRNNTVPSLQNIAGNNFFNGDVLISQGGSNVVIQSDAGTLTFNGSIRYNGSLLGNRAWNFQGNGNTLLAGVISNSVNGSVISIGKAGAGTLTLSNANTFTGNTRIGAGVLRLGHRGALQSSTVDMNSADSGIFSFGSLTSAMLGGLAGLRDFPLTNASFVAVAVTNGNNNQSTDFAGAFKGTGSITKIGSGTFTLSGTNLHTGATLINSGTMRLASNTNYIASLQPLVWFNFENVGGGVVTNLGTGGAAMNGTLTGAGATIIAGGRFGNGLNLDGTGGYVAINNRVTAMDGNTPDVSWTLAMWIKTSQAGAGYAYQGDGSWASGNTAFYLNQGNTTSGTRAGAVRWGGGWLTGNASLNNNAWRFITISVNNGVKNIYVDGVLDATFSAGTWSNASVGNQFWIGGTADNGDGVLKMNGQIDEVCIFGRALSLAEVQSLKNNQPVASLGNYVGKLSPASAVSVASGAALDLNGISQSVPSISDFAGAGGTVLNNSALPLTLTISNFAATMTTFSGTISDSSAVNAISLVKAGANTQILNGAGNFHGTTTVNSGKLLVNATLGGNSVMVAGGTLGGNGRIAGPITIQPAGTISPGTSIGVLTCSNDLTLTGTTFIELDKASSTNDLMRVEGTLNYGGTLTVANLGGSLAVGDAFKIFDAANYSGSFATTNLPALNAGQGWNFDLASGTLSVVQAVATNPTNLTASVSDGVLTLSWPDDHTGWRLETNSVNIADTNFWFFWPESDLTNQVMLPIDPVSTNVFFRLTYP